MSRQVPYKTFLSEAQIPAAYYNIRADMKTDHRPMIHPGSGQPVTADDLSPVFCDELVAQELNTSDRYIPIPEPVRDFYKMYRVLIRLPRRPTRRKRALRNP